MSYFETLTLNGVTYSGETLVHWVDTKLSSQGINEHEKPLYSFIREWISYSNVMRLPLNPQIGEKTDKTAQAVATSLRLAAIAAIEDPHTQPTREQDKPIGSDAKTPVAQPLNESCVLGRKVAFTVIDQDKIVAGSLIF